MNIQEALRCAKAELLNIKSRCLDAQLLMMYVLGCSREDIVFGGEKEMAGDELAKFFDLVDMRKHRIPISHIINRREFWGREFYVDRNVLDPRCDSESLIEAVFARYGKDDSLRILDIGTGSGCLLITLLNELNNATGVGVDISNKALEIAKRNAIGIEGRVEFAESDLFSNVNEKFDLIISNPPYIPSEDIGELEDEVRVYEPRLALDGGYDGLDCYKRIADCFADYLKPGGRIVLEIGKGQENDVAKLFENASANLEEMRKDLADVVRCLVFGL